MLEGLRSMADTVLQIPNLLEPQDQLPPNHSNLIHYKWTHPTQLSMANPDVYSCYILPDKNIPAALGLGCCSSG